MKISLQSDIENLINPKHIPRSIHTQLLSHVRTSSDITVLYGARQVGKSSEIIQCIRTLLVKKQPADIFYFNLDVIPEEFENPDVFVASLLAKKTFPHALTYVFLDEAQRLTNVGLFVKYLHDQKKNIKFILTGSASLDIRSKIKEPLTGRKKEFYLSPLTLEEIILHHGIAPQHIQQSFPQLETVLEQYLLYGGYPAVVTAATPAAKREKLAEITDSYVLRDTTAFFDFGNAKVVAVISRFLAESIGGILSRDNISKLAGISKYQTEKALDALEKSFIVTLVPPLAKSPSKELTHRPKIFFRDTGIRNALLNKVDATLIQADKGQLFENAVATELMALFGRDSVKFWRTTNQTEVDFVVTKNPSTTYAIEAKYAWDRGDALPKNIKSFVSAYPRLVAKALVVSRSTYWSLFNLIR